jgi:MFS family permease
VDTRNITYRYERWRALPAGVLETAGSTFLLLIAVQGLQAGATGKALIAAGGSIGMLLTPVMVWVAQKLMWPTTRLCMAVLGIGAAFLLLGAAWPVLPVFVLCCVVSMTCGMAIIPLLTQVYQDNYSESERGKLFSRSIMIRVAVAAVFSQAAGYFLKGHVARFPWLLAVFALAFLFSGFCLERIPSKPLAKADGGHPFRAMRYMREDRLFRWMILAWMMMGMGNLMMMPMRVEYLANPCYGQALDPQSIAIFTGVIPNIMRLLLSPVWGWLFDRMNFIVIRLVLNVGFIIGILSFFTGGSMTGMVLGSVFYGIAFAGGDVAWSLWVTKLAPPERVADYMSVHTFFTGVRGLIAPLVAFQCIRFLSMPAMGWISAGFIAVACVMLIPEIGYGKRTRPAAALVEEVSE